jgi:N-acetylglucosamine-6-phosphate deacetylase
MDQAVSNTLRFAEVTLSSAVQMAAQNGGKLFPEVKGEIVPGCSADLVLFEYGETLRVKSTWIKGEKINAYRCR